eukprot:9558969-Lingulodinium_polyedra.AAC.1
MCIRDRAGNSLRPQLRLVAPRQDGIIKPYGQLVAVGHAPPGREILCARMATLCQGGCCRTAKRG